MWIGLMDNVLESKVCQFDTWLRFGGLGRSGEASHGVKLGSFGGHLISSMRGEVSPSASDRFCV